MTFTRTLLIFSILTSFASWGRDPFKAIQFHEFQNGMKVILAPTDGSTNLRLKLVVGFGRLDEERNNLQSGHVLEHMLFKDGRIEGNKSYLELLNEAGGDVNAHVTNDHTAYYTTIPADKGEWLVDKFHTMLFGRKLDEHELTLGKSSVQLELGKPFLVHRWFDADVFGSITRNYFPSKSFYEQHFGFPNFPYSREQERLNVKHLKLSDVQNVYEQYYYPGNMTVLVSGKFNPKTMLKLLKQKFSKIENKGSKRTEGPRAKFIGEDYLKVATSFFGGNASFTYGRKLFNRKAEEILATDAYMEYVAHRLMIELRNKKGETYTARAWTNYSRGAGTTEVTFNTQYDRFDSNKAFVENLIAKEAVKGEISDDQIKKAIDLYLKQNFEIRDVDADGVMRLAETYAKDREEFGIKKSPYAILATMKPEDFRNHLTTTFNTSKLYQQEAVEPLLFEYDFLFILFISILGSVIVFKSLWKTKDEPHKIEHAFKLTTSPGAVVEVMALFFMAVVMSWMAQRPFEYFYENSSFYMSSQLLSTYLESIVSISVLVGIFMRLMCNLPTRMVICTDGNITIKSLIIKTVHFAISDIREMQVVPVRNKYKGFLARFGIMSLMFDYFFVRSSLLITLHDGSSFYLNLNNAEAVKSTINEFGKATVEETSVETQVQVA